MKIKCWCFSCSLALSRRGQFKIQKKRKKDPERGAKRKVLMRKVLNLNIGL